MLFKLHIIFPWKYMYTHRCYTYMYILTKNIITLVLTWVVDKEKLFIFISRKIFHDNGQRVLRYRLKEKLCIYI
jgi:hypothetical protein